MTPRRLRVALAIAAVVALVTGIAVARVGGGQGYSGGGGSGGGGADGVAVGALFRLLLWLVFRHPVVGIPLLILIIVILVRVKAAGLTMGPGVPTTSYGGPPAYAPPKGAGRVGLDPLIAADPNFSEPLFVDLAQLVYVRAQEMRGAGKAEPLAPWVSPDALSVLFSRREGLETVRDVVLGATRIGGFAAQGGFHLLWVRFEANIVEVRGGASSQLLCNESWVFRRRAGVLSPGPERMRRLGCASCGSADEPKTDGTCASCGTPRTGGATQWEVFEIASADRRPLTPPELNLGGGVERGVELPTIYDAALPAQRRAFDARHPEHSWSDFDARIRDVFTQLQTSWSTGRWEAARPLETDALFQVHRFWMERYRAFGLVNRVEDTRVEKVDVVKIGKDAFFESITVRILASCLDWTEDRAGKVAGGSESVRRIFTEYWTFLRTVGGRAKGAEAATCPSCGAPIEGMQASAVCAYCGSQILSATFDWVLSRIEQDDAYAG